MNKDLRTLEMRGLKMAFWGAVVLGALLLLLLIFGRVGIGTKSDLVLFLGRFHPLILHLPIGALSVVLLMEAGRWLMRGKWVPQVGLPLIFAAATGLLAIVAGYLLGQADEYDKELLNEHFWWGTGFGVFLFASAVFYFWPKSSKLLKPRNATWAYWACLGMSTLAMSVAGHHGASITHGDSYLFDHAPDFIRQMKGMKPKKSGQSEATGGNALAEEPIFFIAQVQPILEKKCYECHNEKKIKGKLRLDSYDFLMKGGEEGPSVVAGKSAESPIIQRILLPHEDEYHMPPSAKPQISEEELEILKAWIDTGAKPDAKSSELALPEKVKKLLGVTAAPKVEIKAIKMLATERLQDLEKELEVFKNRFPGSLGLSSRSGEDLEFTHTSLSEFSSADFQSLVPLMPRFTRFSIKKAQLSDADYEALTKATQLKSLSIKESKISAKALQAISSIPHLESLNLYQCQIEEAGINALEKSKTLKVIYLGRTNLNTKSLEALSSKFKVITNTLQP